MVSGTANVGHRVVGEVIGTRHSRMSVLRAAPYPLFTSRLPHKLQPEQTVRACRCDVRGAAVNPLQYNRIPVSLFPSR